MNDEKREEASISELADDGEELRLDYTVNRIYALQERYLNEIGRLEKMVRYLAEAIAGRDGIVSDIIEAAREAVKQS